VLTETKQVEYMDDVKDPGKVENKGKEEVIQE
jgi:hypothetical protein